MAGKASLKLNLSGGGVQRVLDEPGRLLANYQTDDGIRYLNFQSLTPADRLVPEDLAVTILINSHVNGAAFKSVQDYGSSINLDGIPDRPFESLSSSERDQIATLISQVAGWSGFAASVATKVLHKKRPKLIPILDNQAIFGANMNPRWPQQRSSTYSVYAYTQIKAALDAIASDLISAENQNAWSLLEQQEPSRTRIEIFDMIWWCYFREIEPVKRSEPAI